jgi:hypothetical protein
MIIVIVVVAVNVIFFHFLDQNLEKCRKREGKKRVFYETRLERKG